jgi:hypothetical protein
MKYRYEVNGTAANGQTWSASGIIETKSAGEFISAISMALAEAFQQLTEGKAVYGNPGVGCSGPYTCTKMLIEQQGESNAQN